MNQIRPDSTPPAGMPQRSHWHNYASHWRSLDSPLRPHADDISVYAHELGADTKTLLLGVTPEIAGLNLHGVAVDNNTSMIRAVWPHPPGWDVVSGDWLSLPLQAGAVSQVVGDGSLCLLRYPHDYAALAAELRRVMRPEGKLVLRLFASPANPETLLEIRHAVSARHIGSFHALKWRLAMALAARGDGVHVGAAELLAAFNSLFPDRAQLLQQQGWDAAVFNTIDVYDGSEAVFSFPTLERQDDWLRSWATQVRYRSGGYEMAERCPIAVVEGLRAP